MPATGSVVGCKIVQPHFRVWDSDSLVVVIGEQRGTGDESRFRFGGADEMGGLVADWFCSEARRLMCCACDGWTIGRRSCL